MATLRPTSKRWASAASCASGNPETSASQCIMPLTRCAPSEAATSSSTTGLVGSQFAGPIMPRHWRAKKRVMSAWCAVMPGICAASRQKASVLRKPVRSALNGQRAQASWRKRGSSSASPVGPSPPSPNERCSVSRPSWAPSAASSIWRPGETARCQAQSAQARPSDTGDRSAISGAALACNRRSRRCVGDSGARSRVNDTVGVGGLFMMSDAFSDR